MGIGAAIRHRLGPFESPAAEVYRSLFIDLDELAAQLAVVTPAPNRVLEIGCGDGSMADRMCRVYPHVSYFGIDVADDPGRRFTFDRHRASFRTITSADLVAERPDPFDLVVLVDVLHHVPDGQRADLLTDAATLATPDGVVAVKEWDRSNPLGLALAYAADKWISGDPAVRFMAGDELRSMVSGVGLALLGESWIRPWRNNLLLTAMPSQSQPP